MTYCSFSIVGPTAIVAASVFFSIGANTLHAGQVDLQSPSHKPLPASHYPTATSDDLVLERQPNSSIWKFSFKDPAKVFATMTVSVNVTASGYEAQPLEILVPFYWNGYATIALAVPLVNDSHFDQSTDDFLRSTTDFKSKTISQIYLLNQRARRIFKARYDELERHARYPEPNDVRIAYWLLFTTSQLIEKRHIAVDPVTKLAGEWMVQQMSDTAVSGRLFGTKTVDIDTVNKLIQALQFRNSFIYNLAIQKLSDKLKSTKAEDIADACLKVMTLRADLMATLPDDIPQYNGNFANALQVHTNAVICSIQKLRQSKSPADLQEAAEVAKAAFEAIVASANDTRWVREREYAVNRQNELSTMLPP